MVKHLVVILLSNGEECLRELSTQPWLGLSELCSVFSCLDLQIKSTVNNTCLYPKLSYTKPKLWSSLRYDALTYQSN
ncbi:hypothetical protein GIB67_006288 [Kingdonia uniflora]|uniref:Uncharacterized protein n=1 Tax=Kingdonia uniflora TaxID=39325 RepID=A0A7J7P5B3_9MAGN|nr:hypothetical protein GIB67_006288 [Kingdonia uniflora]